MGQVAASLKLKTLNDNPYLIAEIDKKEISSLPSNRIANLSLFLPTELYPQSFRESFTKLNKVSGKYHHDDDYPSPDQWNTDAEACFELMSKSFHYLEFFPKAFHEYVNEHGRINYDEQKKSYLDKKIDVPVLNSLEYSLPDDYDLKCMIEFEQEDRFSESLESDLRKLYEVIQYKTTQTYGRVVVGIPDELIDSLDDGGKEALVFLNNNHDFYSRLTASRYINTYDDIIHPILFNPTWNLTDLEGRPFSGGPVSLKRIALGLKGINPYAIKLIVDLHDADELFKTKSIQKALDSKDSEIVIHALSELQKRCDITALRNIANLSLFLQKRDRGFLLKKRDTCFGTLSPKAITPQKCGLIIRERAHAIEDTIKQALAEIFERRNGEQWQQLYPYEQKYLIDILDAPEAKPFMVSLRNQKAKEAIWNSLSDRQKHIYGLRKTIDDTRYMLLQKGVEEDGYDITIEEVKSLLERALEAGLIYKQDPDFLIKASLLCSMTLSFKYDDGVDNFLDLLISAGEEATEKGLFDKTDEDYLKKSIELAALKSSNGTNGYSKEEAERAISEANEDISFTDSESRLYLLHCGLVIPLFLACDYIIKNYPLGLYRFLKDDAQQKPKAIGSTFFTKEIQYLWAKPKEVFSFLQSMTSFGQQRLLADIDCPIWRREELLSSIQNGDSDTFINICQSEKLSLIEDFSIIVGFINEFIEKPINLLFHDNLDNGQSDVVEEMMINNGGILGFSSEVESEWMNLISSETGHLKLMFPDMPQEEFEECASIVFVLVGIYCFFSVFKIDEVAVINSDILCNPRFADILKVAQVYYFIFFGDWPKNTQLLWSPEEREYLGRCYSGEEEPHIDTTGLDVAPSVISSNKNNVIQYTLPDDLFDGKKVDIVYGYIPGLRESLRSIDEFGPLFNFILRAGGISTNEEAGALLRVFTGYPVENASQKAKWEADYHILYYLVKYMFTPKKSYVSMSQCIDIYYPSDDEKRKAEKSPSSYAERISGDDAPYIIETLSRLSSVFPRPETPIAD